jgi:hypothetical protein
MITIKQYIIYKKNKIPLTFYQNTFYKIQKLLVNIFNNESLNIFAIDGTYSNININKRYMNRLNYKHH